MSRYTEAHDGGDGSRLIHLIDDIVIPDTGAHARTTEMDIVMTTTLAAMERTRKQWDDLLDDADLELLQRVTYLEDTAENIQVVDSCAETTGGPADLVNHILGGTML